MAGSEKDRPFQGDINAVVTHPLTRGNPQLALTQLIGRLHPGGGQPRRAGEVPTSPGVRGLVRQAARSDR